MEKIIKYPTIFVDIDGTLVKYRKFDEVGKVDLEPIQDVIDQINEAFDLGAHIVITTARPWEYELFTKQELEKVNVKYHQLVMGIGRGTRYLINDKDPEKPEIERSVSINLVRNKGFRFLGEIPTFINYESN